MFKTPISCQLTVMVMVENEQQAFLTIDRVKSWKGITFPGGHLEPAESVLDCARREVLEETGIVIHHLISTGLIHWYDRDTGERYLIFCIRARALSGSLKNSAEGTCAWLTMEELLRSPLSPGFKEQLRMFTDVTPMEAFGTYGVSGDSPLSYDDGGKAYACETINI